MARKAIGALIRNNVALTSGIANQLDATHSSEGVSRSVPLDNISLNPNNPRQQLIEPARLVLIMSEEKRGKISFLSKDEERFFESVVSLADTIAEHGLTHPILVEEHANGQLNIVAGYRRFLAHIYLGRKSIRATVRQVIQSNLQRNLIAFTENTSRVDLTLKEQISALIPIVEAYEVENNRKLSGAELAKLIGVSRGYGFQYMQIIRSNKVLLDKVLSGDIKDMRTFLAAEKEFSKSLDTSPINPNKTTYKISPVISRAVVERIFALTGFSSTVDWSDQSSVKSAWKAFLEQMDTSNEH
jgi:ParB/RepB/Spo0J family partition protein